SPGDVGQGIAAPPFYARHRLLSLRGLWGLWGPGSTGVTDAARVGPSCGAAADRTVSRLSAAVSRQPSAGDEGVELAVLDAQQHRLDLRRGVDECGTVGEAGVAPRHVPAGQPGELHAGP